MAMADVITIDGLTTVDRYDLEDSLGSNDLTFVERPLRPGDFGELGTLIATIIVSKLALAALAICLARRTVSETLKLQVKITRGNSVEERTLEVAFKSAEPRAEQIAATLARVFNLNERDVADIVKEREA
jgi:hypothetical protein